MSRISRKGSKDIYEVIKRTVNTAAALTPRGDRGLSRAHGSTENMAVVHIPLSFLFSSKCYVFVLGWAQGSSSVPELMEREEAVNRQNIELQRTFGSLSSPEERAKVERSEMDYLVSNNRAETVSPSY